MEDYQPRHRTPSDGRVVRETADPAPEQAAVFKVATAAIPTGPHPSITGLLADLPTKGQSWTEPEQQKFITLLGDLVRYVYPAKPQFPEPR